MMRFGTAIASLVLLAVAIPSTAQNTRPRHRHSSGAHLLNKGLGQAVAERALQTHAWDYYASDCSHFVNAIFDAVGLPFPYTNSVKLYTGTEEFRRVLHPQPGDLIVWRGHVGIVIDPLEHTFYSMLRSGLRLSSYRSSYWRQRGYARFFRYVMTPSVLARHHSVRLARLRAGGR